MITAGIRICICQHRKTSIMDKQFSRKIIFFNFLYSIIILLYHADAGVHFSGIVATGTALDSAAQRINLLLAGSNGTYFFMLLSAFLLYRDLSGDKIKGKLHRRIQTLLIPWLLWNGIGLLSYHEFDKGFSYLLRYYFTSRFCEQLWFVEALMILLLFIPLFRRLFKIKYVREAVLLAVFVTGYFRFPFLRSADFFPSERFQMEVLRVLEHVPVYCLGAYLGLNFADFVVSEEYNIRHRMLSLAAALLILFVSCAFPYCFAGYVSGRLQSVAIWIILSKKYFTFEPAWWMQLSFYTYAIHNFVLHWEGKIIRITGIFAEEFAGAAVSEVFALLWRVSLSGIAFLLIIVSAKILMRFTPGFYKALSGGRLPGRKS